MAARRDITAEYVRQLLDYDQVSRLLRWRERSRSEFNGDKAWKTFNTRYAGKVAGSLREDGFSRITISYQKFYCHQIVWLIIYSEWPSGQSKYKKDIKASKLKNPLILKRKVKNPEDRRKAQREATARWLAKPGNKEVHKEAAKRCRETPAAKERHRIRQLNYVMRNREQERLRAATWRKNFPDKDRITRRNYYLKNLEKVRAASKKRRLANPETYKEYSRQYKHAKRAGGGRLSKGYLKRLMIEQNGLCAACGCDLSISGYHLDHKIAISNGGLHCDANVQLLCPMCNHRKSNKNFEDFLGELEREKIL